MNDEALVAARARIAGQRGELRGWRPLTVGDIAVTAVQVLGMARGAHGAVGIRVVVAGRTGEAIGEQGPAVAEMLLRRRAVLGPDDPFAVEHMGQVHEGDGQSTDPLTWPWTTLVIHAPERQLPAIAGLATNEVPREDE
ncbi:MAG TPA: hypothetical protein VNL71_16860 [Chloroflexota bacterium]|nr:hypothetical protein [Chloroflexota bacterium]